MLLPLAALPLCLLAPPTPAAVLPVPAAVQERDSEEQARFIAGLAEKGLHDVVVREARDFLQRFPGHARAELTRYRLAEALYALGRHEEAAEEFRPLARRKGFAHVGEAAFRLAQCDLEAGRLDAAARGFSEVRGAGGYLAPAASFFLAETRFRQGRFGEAEAAYQVALEGRESAYAREALYGLVWCAARQGQHERVLERAAAFERAHPDDELTGELRVLAAEAHMGAQRPEQALELFRSVKAGPAAESALRGSAAALGTLEKHEECARAWEALLRRFPDSARAPEDALQHGIAWLRAGQAERALAALSDPRVGDGAEAQAWRAHAHLRAGAPEAALRCADQALAQAAEGDLRTRLLTVRAEALAKLGRADEASRAYEQSGTRAARLAAAITSLNAGEAEQACRLADALLADAGAQERAAVLLVRGEALLALGQLERAEKDFTALLGARPDGAQEARARERLGWCRHLRGDSAGAAQAFGEVIARHASAPEAEEARWMLGHARAASGDAEGARAAWQAYLQQHPRGVHRSAARLELARAGGAEGLAALETLLKESPPAEVEAQALLLRGELHAGAARWKEAAASYRALLERQPDSAQAPAARYGLGHAQHSAGEHARAAATLAQAAEAAAAGSVLRASALELRVWALAGANAPADEQAAAWRAFATESGVEDARALAAWRPVLASLQPRKEGPAARALLEELIERLRAPDVAVDALVELAWLTLDEGSTDTAEAVLRSAHKLRARLAGEQGARDAALAEATFFAGEARYAAKAWAKAGEHYGAALPLAKGELRARILYKQGFACTQAGDAAGARKAFTALVSDHASSELYGEALFLLGDALLQQGELAAAAETLGRVARELPRHAVALKARAREGVALARLQRWSEAEAALAEAAKRAGATPYEGQAEAELWRGRALAATGDARSARAAFERVLALDKGSLAAHARLELGRAARAAGDEEAALAEFLKVALLYARGEETAEALLESGASLERMGDVARARAQYSELLEHQADSSFAPRARERLRALER